MASSAVCLVLYLRDAAGNHAETPPRSWCIYPLCTPLRIAKKTRDQYIEAMSKVCDGLRGDAFVTAQEVGFDNLCEIVDASTRY